MPKKTIAKKVIKENLSLNLFNVKRDIETIFGGITELFLIAINDRCHEVWHGNYTYLQKLKLSPEVQIIYSNLKKTITKKLVAIDYDENASIATLFFSDLGDIEIFDFLSSIKNAEHLSDNVVRFNSLICGRGHKWNLDGKGGNMFDYEDCLILIKNLP